MGCGASLPHADDKIAKYKADPEKYADEAAKQALDRQTAAPVNPSKTKKPIAAVMVKGSLFKQYTIKDKNSLKVGFCLAKNIHTGITRACRKIVKQRVSADKIKEEIAIMGALDHPNILQLYEIFSDKLHYYFIEAHCRGGRLLEQLVSADSSSGFYWNEPLIAHILVEVLRGVSYMHASLVCHRNLEFQRLLLLDSPAGKAGVPLHKGTVLIADFSLACRFEQGGTMSEDVREWAFWPAMAPELLIGSPYSQLCDLWTCGVGTYWLLCGELPFAGEDPDELLAQIARTQNLSHFASATWKNVSQKAKHFMTGLICRDVGQRWSAQEALNDPWLVEDATLADEHYRDAQKKPMQAFHIANSLREYYEQSQLQKKALQVIAHRLQHDEIRELGRTFLALDTNHDGVVTIQELQQGLQKMQGKLEGEPGLQELMRIMKSHEQKYIEYTEFLAAVMDEKYYQQESFALVAFRYFDKDGDEKITAKELLKSLASDTENTEDPKFRALCQSVMASIKKFDADGNECIDFEEFCNMLQDDRTHDQPITAVRSTKMLSTLSGGPKKGTHKSGPCAKCEKVLKLRYIPRNDKYYCAACALEEM